MQCRILISLASICFAIVLLLQPCTAWAQVEASTSSYWISDETAEWESYSVDDIVGPDEPPLFITDEVMQPQYLESDGTIQTLFQQQAPLVPQQQTPQRTPQPAAAQAATTNLFGELRPTQFTGRHYGRGWLLNRRRG